MGEIDRKQIKKMYFKEHIRIGEISQKTGIKSKELLPILGFSSWSKYNHSRQDQLQKLRAEQRLKIKKLKPQIMKKYNDKCYSCHSTKNLEIHHIIPITAGGKAELDNLMLVCKKCHKRTGRLKGSEKTYPRHSKPRCDLLHKPLLT